MKKMLALLLAALLCLPCAFSLAEEAGEAEREIFSFGDFEYALLYDGTAEITRYIGRVQALEVPSELDGYAITSIGNEAFYGCYLTAVTIPDSVTCIGDEAFSNCYSLTDVTIPDSVTCIGDEAFSNCYSLTDVTIPDSVTCIGDEAFFRCESLTDVTIPDNVTSIGANPFTWCKNLTQITVSPDHPTLTTIDGVLFSKAEKRLVTCPRAFTDLEYAIPQGIRIIGDHAFHGSRLTAVTIPDSVTSIGDGAFSQCPDLTATTIPDSVTSIGTNPFQDCKELTQITVSPDHPALATIGGVLFSKPDKRLVTYPFAFTDSEYAIPQGIEIIGDSAFRDCFRLTAVTIPDSVTSIGDWAFFCTSLNIVTIPDSVTSIGDHAFHGSRLTAVTIPDSVTSIGNEAFCNCYSLTTVTIPDSVTSIGANPFQDCEELTQITVSPDHPALATIGGILFSKPDKRLVTYPCAFTDSEYAIPQGTEIIGDSAFRDCFRLTAVTIPDSVTSIGKSAFCDCSNLTTMTIPDSVTSIGKSAFRGCSSLTTMTIPDSVTSIGYDTFWGCTGLTEIIVGHDSWARQYCIDHDLPYTYPDANDWLNG